MVDKLGKPLEPPCTLTFTNVFLIMLMNSDTGKITVITLINGTTVSQVFISVFLYYFYLRALPQRCMKNVQLLKVFFYYWQIPSSRMLY